MTFLRALTWALMIVILIIVNIHTRDRGRRIGDVKHSCQ